MKSPLRAKRAALEELWKQGLSGISLLIDQSRIADEFLCDCLEKADLHDLEESFALVALGGYGRQELYPFSDIDIMILFAPEVEDQVGRIADAVLYPLWDTGLEVGHGVRTVDQSMEHAVEDFFFRVALIDARYLGGGRELFDELLFEYKERFVKGKRQEFVETMQEFRDERRENFGSHSYLLEPHIKDGKGGLRDIQAMLWTSQVVFGLSGLDGITGAGLLMEEERKSFEDSWDMLIRLRNRLHYISKRKNDQLYFEQQEEMASAFGFHSDGNMLPVENFMREVYAHMQNVAVVTDLFFDHVDEVLGNAGKTHECFPDKRVEKGVEIRGNRVHLIAARHDLEKKPHLLMRVFLASARTGARLHHRTLRLVSANLDLVDEKFQNSTRMSKAFTAILMEAKYPFSVLEAMLQTGMLQSYIPEFAHIETLSQHDIYHIYTVDRHSLQTVAELHRVIEENGEVISLVPDVSLLFIAALLHDIGKGSGKDHSKYGAELMRVIGRRIGMSKDSLADLVCLVEYHLFIPENALRRDLEDAAFIKRCAEEIGSLERLCMLYLLSIADSRATGPSAWSEWKASLMLDMFLKLKPHLEQGGVVLDGGREFDACAQEGVLWLRGKVLVLLKSDKGVIVDVEGLPVDYLSSFSPEAVAHHVRIHRDNHTLIRQKSVVLANEFNDHWSLLVMSTDHPGLLAKICGVMALNNLDVVNARIFTWHDGTTVDVMDVRPTDGSEFAEKDWQALNEDLDLAIARRLGLGHRLFQKLSGSYGRRFELTGNIEPKVVVDNNSSDRFTVIEVYAADLPGQLYHITQALADFGITIYKAFIATEVEQLIDVFYVLDKNGCKIEEKDFTSEIVQGLLYSVGKTMG